MKTKQVPYKIKSPPDQFTLTIHVTREDFKRGQPSNCGKCPVALAVIRALNEQGYKYKSVEVPGGFDATISLCDKTGSTLYKGVEMGVLKIDEFIDFFDNYSDSVFNYDISINEDSLISKYLHLPLAKQKEFLTQAFKPFKTKVKFSIYNPK